MRFAIRDEKDLTALDGFAVRSDTQGIQLSVIFADYKAACGAALATGVGSREQAQMPSGLANHHLLGASLMMGSPAVLEPDTYPRSGAGDRLEVVYSPTDGQCRAASPAPQNGDQMSLTITTIDADHVVGSVAFTDDVSGAVFNGSFDFPFCGLPESGPVMCCPE